MSFTLWLTRSSPTVSKRPACNATSTLVPTPSVLSTSVGLRQSGRDANHAPEGSDRPSRQRGAGTGDQLADPCLGRLRRLQIDAGRRVFPRLARATGSASTGPHASDWANGTWVRSWKARTRLFDLAPG